MKKSIVYLALMLSLLPLFCSAVLVASEDFQDGWTSTTAGTWLYGEFVANDFVCSTEVNCASAGSGSAGVYVTTNSDGVKYLRLYSIYPDSPYYNSGVKFTRLRWNITGITQPYNFSDLDYYALSFNFNPIDTYEYYSDVYNQFTILPLKTTNDQTSGLDLLSRIAYVTSPGSSLVGWWTNWDSLNHNTEDYPFTYTGIGALSTGAWDEAYTSLFKTHGTCHAYDDTWNTAFILFRINATGGDTNTITGQDFYVNGVKCWEMNISANRQVKNLGDFDVFAGLEFLVRNQQIGLDNIKLYQYPTGTDWDDILYDINNDSIITAQSTDYNPPDNGDYSVSESLFGSVYAAKWLLLIALFLVGLFVVLGAKYAGMTGATMLGALSTIGFTVIGWIPIWVTVLVVVLSAIAFGSKVAGFIGGGE